MVGSYRSLQNCRKFCLRQLRVEFLGNCLTEDHEILRAYLGQSAPQTGYDLTSYLRCSFIEVRKRVENIARLLRVWVKFLENGLSEESQNFTHLLGTSSFTNLPDMTSLAASGWLQNAV